MRTWEEIRAKLAEAIEQLPGGRSSRTALQPAGSRAVTAEQDARRRLRASEARLRRLHGAG